MPRGQFTCPEEIKSKGVPPQGHQPLWGSDFPWSMWAMMEKFRIFDWSVKKIHLRKMGNGQVILGCTPRRSPADRRRGQAPALQNRVMIGAPAGAPALRALRIPAATALVFQGHAPMAARRAQPVQRSRSQGLRGNRDTCCPRRGVVGPSYGSFAFGQARKLIPSAGPLLPSRHCDSRAEVARQSRRSFFPARFIRHRRRFAGKLSPPNPLRSRWRLCRLTDAACPLRVLRWASAGAPVTASASQWGRRQCAVGLRPVRTAHRRREPPFRGAPGEHPRPLLSPHFFGKKWGRPPRRRRRGRFR